MKMQHDHFLPRSVRMRIRAAILSAALLGLANVSYAATVTYVGSQLGLGSPTGSNTNGSAAGWRTPSVSKAHDIDGDNVYGTLGYVLFNPKTYTAGGLGQGAALTGAQISLPSYMTLNLTGANISYNGNYTTIDNPANPSGPPIYSGITYKFNASGSTEVGLYSVDFGAGLPANTTYRLGFFVDNTGPLDGSPIGLRVTGGGGDSLLVSKPQATQVNNYYFFDLENVIAGDSFSIIVQRSHSGLGPVTLGGLTFDAVTVPEPTAICLLLTSVAAVCLVTRRKISK